MKREQVAFLAAGVVLGFVVGFVVAWGITSSPEPSGMPATRAPRSSSMPGSGSLPTASDAPPMQERMGALNRRIAENPEDAEALVELATLYMQVSMYPQAQEYLTRAVEIDADNAHARTHLGVVLGQNGDLDGAREQFELVVAAVPDGWQGWFYLAVTSARMEDLPRAREATSRLEVLNPDLPELADLKQRLAEHG